LATLAAGVMPTRSLARLARPTLADLAASVGEAAGLSVPDGDLVHYVEQVDTPNPVSVRDWTGSRIPMHAVSSGQVLLAFRPAAALDRYLERPLERFTDLTIVEPEALRDRLHEVRRDGYAWAREEFDRGISSVAAPIADGSGEVVAAVHLHGPSYRFPGPGTEASVAGRVVAAAAQIANSLRQAG
jgi:DNA-binding IclR family transcriptional regulator